MPPRCTLQVESGTEYGELRGVTMECDVDLVTDRVAAIDGRLTVTSPQGGPTVVRAELPCGR